MKKHKPAEHSDNQIFQMLKDFIEKDFTLAPSVESKGVSGPYRGINSLLTGMAIAANGFDSDTFMTFHAIKENGGQLRKGAKATYVTAYNVIYKLDGVKITEERYNLLKDREEYEDRLRKSAYVSAIPVFNLAQCDGIPYEKIGTPVPGEIANSLTEEDLAVAERLETAFLAWQNRPALDVDHDVDVCVYDDDTDTIKKPEVISKLASCLSFAREIVRSTGSRIRLNRFTFSATDEKGKNSERLVSELGANIILSRLGVGSDEQKSIAEHSAAFMKKWLSSLTRSTDRTACSNFAMYSALRNAVDAANFVMNVQ